MKQDTYDIEAYRFAILIANDSNYPIDDNDYIKYFNMSVDVESVYPIPFNEVDGLLIKEILNIFNRRGLAFVCYTKIGKGFSTKGLKIFFKMILTPGKAEENSDLTIDKLVENNIIRLYNSSNDNLKKVFRCFFERYQDGSYQKTTERVKKIEQQINRN